MFRPEREYGVAIVESEHVGTDIQGAACGGVLSELLSATRTSQALDGHLELQILALRIERNHIVSGEVKAATYGEVTLDNRRLRNTSDGERLDRSKPIHMFVRSIQG